jgi:hypothetical protein
MKSPQSLGSASKAAVLPNLGGHMTIKDAIALYSQPESSGHSPALRELINYMIDQNIKTEFENDSYLDALTLTELMFRRSTKSIRMLTGPQGDGFLAALKKPFREALDRITSTGGKVQIVVLGQANSCLDTLQKEFPATLFVRQAKSANPLKHFTVCDTRMARVEQLHAELTSDTPASEIKARVCFNDPVQAKALEDGFDRIWNWLTQFPTPAPPKSARNEAVHSY